MCPSSIKDDDAVRSFHPRSQHDEGYRIVASCQPRSVHVSWSQHFISHQVVGKKRRHRRMESLDARCAQGKLLISVKRFEGPDRSSPDAVGTAGLTRGSKCSTTCSSAMGEGKPISILTKTTRDPALARCIIAKSLSDYLQQHVCLLSEVRRSEVPWPGCACCFSF